MPVRRLDTRLAQVGQCLAPQLAVERVLRQPFQPFAQAVAVQVLDRTHDACMDFTAPAFQQFRVRDFVREGVAERVFRIREKSRLDQHFGRHQMFHHAAQVRHRQTGDGTQQFERQLVADHGRVLQYPLLVGGQTVDPRRENGLDGRGHPETEEGLLEPVGAARTRQHTGLKQGANDLFDKKRVSAGVFPHKGLDQCNRGFRAEQCRHQIDATGHGQRFQAYKVVAGIAGRVLRARTSLRDEQQDAVNPELGHQLTEHAQRQRVVPVKVVQHRDQRAYAALVLQQTRNRPERGLAAQFGVGRTEWMVGRQHVEQVQQRRDVILEEGHAEQHPPGDLVADRRCVVQFADLEISAQQIDHRRIRRVVSQIVGGGLQHRPAGGVGRVHKLIHQPRFADPGFTGHGGHLTAAGRGSGERIAQRRHFRVAPHEWCESTAAGGLQA